MNAAELIEYIRTAEKKTPVKVYLWERSPTSFPNARVFPAGDGTKIVFGDWRDIGPAVRAQQDAIADIVIESSCRNSAVPLGRNDTVGGLLCHRRLPSLGAKEGFPVVRKIPLG